MAWGISFLKSLALSGSFVPPALVIAVDLFGDGQAPGDSPKPGTQLTADPDRVNRTDQALVHPNPQFR